MDVQYRIWTQTELGGFNKQKVAAPKHADPVSKNIDACVRTPHCRANDMPAFTSEKGTRHEQKWHGHMPGLQQLRGLNKQRQMHGCVAVTQVLMHHLHKWVFSQQRNDSMHD